MFGLNRKFAAEKKIENNPLQGIKNTFGSIKDELFSDDYWDDDPWDNQIDRNYKRCNNFFFEKQDGGENLPFQLIPDNSRNWLAQK